MSTDKSWLLPVLCLPKSSTLATMATQWSAAQPECAKKMGGGLKKSLLVGVSHLLGYYLSYQRPYASHVSEGKVEKRNTEGGSVAQEDGWLPEVRSEIKSLHEPDNE